MIDSWQLLQVQSGGPAQPFEYMHSHAPLHPSGVEPSHQGTPLHKDTGIAESRCQGPGSCSQHQLIIARWERGPGVAKHSEFLREARNLNV